MPLVGPVEAIFGIQSLEGKFSYKRRLRFYEDYGPRSFSAPLEVGLGRITISLLIGSQLWFS